MSGKTAIEEARELTWSALHNAWENVIRKLEEWQERECNRTVTGDQLIDSYEDGLITGTICGLRMAADLVGIEQKREDQIAELQKLESESPLVVGNSDV